MRSSPRRRFLLCAIRDLLLMAALVGISGCGSLGAPALSMLRRHTGYIGERRSGPPEHSSGIAAGGFLAAPTADRLRLRSDVRAADEHDLGRALDNHLPLTRGALDDHRRQPALIVKGSAA